jgi:hypothetical protein
VQYIDVHGMNEPGIDGGGLFREFLTSVLMEGFNPETGFFRESPEHRLHGARFRQKFTLEDAIGSHACSLEALACV